jgi:HAD superfamily hydrolase (TIGR01509 family)
MPIRAVLFDLGNTLVSYYNPPDFMPILRRSLRACLSTLGLTPLEHEAQTTLVHQALELNQERADLAVWPLEERLRVLFSRYNPTAAQLERMCSAFLVPIFATAQINADALPVLTCLKQAGVRTAVVSNTPWGSSGRVWRAELDRHGLLSRLDAVVFCTDVGWRKPHPAVFRRALELLDTTAEHAVFVGDDPVWDVEGARSAGVRPVLLTSAEHPTPPTEVPTATSLPDVLLLVNEWNSAAIVDQRSTTSSV